MPHCVRVFNDSVFGLAWTGSHDVAQRRFHGPDAEQQAIKWASGMARHLERSPMSQRTCGETTRQHRRRCQALAAYVQHPIHNAEAREYWQAVLVEATAILERLEAEPPDAPSAGRRAAVACSEPGCNTTVWVPARTLWHERQDRRERRQWCLDHHPPAGPQPPLVPWTAAERDEQAEITVGRLLALIPQVFREPDATLCAWVSTGKWDRLVHSWETNLRLLAGDCGGQAEAWARLRQAADEAELLHYLDQPPEPVVEPDPAPAAPVVDAPGPAEPPPPGSHRSEKPQETAARRDPPGDLPPEPDAHPLDTWTV